MAQHSRVEKIKRVMANFHVTYLGAKCEPWAIGTGRACIRLCGGSTCQPPRPQDPTPSAMPDAR